MSGVERKGLWKRIVVIFAGLVGGMAVLASCIPEPLEVRDLPAPKQEIVVSTQVIPDTTLIVLLTRTIGALDASDNSDFEDLLDKIAVNDAVVTLEGPLRTDTLDFLSSGIYVAPAVVFRAGERYTLSVRSETMGTAYATTEVRQSVPFMNVGASLYSNGFESFAQVAYTLSDPLEANWYMINVQEVDRDDMLKNLLDPRTFTVLFTDTKFNGNTYGEDFVVLSRHHYRGDTLAVSLSNISQEYYRFMQLRAGNQFNFLEFISEPVNYPSNVVGGRGYFNLYVPDVRVIVLE